MSREVSGDLKPSDVGEDGVWTLPDGSKVLIESLEMTLPEWRGGKEKVSMAMMDLTGYVDQCPLCDVNPPDGFTIFLEKYYYLALRCCDTLLLYELEKNELEEWIEEWA